MQISPDTKMMARINKSANSRGIIPYNNYFEKTNTNAICLELHNPQLKILLDGIKSLNFQGAISVAFEYDQEIFDLMDEIDPICHKTNAIGFVTQRNGKYTGYTQGGWGLKKALE